MTVLNAFRLPVELVEKLTALAKATHRSEKFYVAAALGHYFEDYADAQIAKDRFNAPKSKIISSKKLSLIKVNTTSDPPYRSGGIASPPPNGIQNCRSPDLNRDGLLMSLRNFSSVSLPILPLWQVSKNK